MRDPVEGDRGRRDDRRQQPGGKRPLAQPAPHIGVGQHDDAAQLQRGDRRDRPDELDVQRLDSAGHLAGERDQQDDDVEALPDPRDPADRLLQVVVQLPLGQRQVGTPARRDVVHGTPSGVRCG